MAKVSGKIGYALQANGENGIWTEEISERTYYGNLIQNSRRLQSSDQGINDNIEISNRFSIIADPFAFQNFHAMRYVEFMGAKWKIREVEVQFPRLILSIGGLYNG